MQVTIFNFVVATVKQLCCVVYSIHIYILYIHMFFFVFSLSLFSLYSAFSWLPGQVMMIPNPELRLVVLDLQQQPALRMTSFEIAVICPVAVQEL